MSIYRYFNFILLLFIIPAGVAYGTDNQLKRKELAQIYSSQVGVREATGNNDGLQVETFLHAAKAKRGQSWCAAFVSWCLQLAGIKHPITAWAAAMFPAKNTIYTRGRPPTATPQQGDVFGLYYTNLGRIGHVGFIHDWGNGNIVVTVEGNTNEAASREGDGVYKKKRLKRQIYKVSNFIDL